MSDKPTAAFVLSLIAGILIMIEGIIYAVAGAICGEIIGVFVPLAGAIFILMMALELIFGVIVIVGATLINKAEPSKVKSGSIIVLIFSILSIFTGSGGFIVGLILGVIGGILGLVWKPPQAPPPPPAPSLPAFRVCPSCGAQIDPSYNVCPYCGKAIPKA